MIAPWSDLTASRLLTNRIGLNNYQVADGLVTWAELRAEGLSLMVDDGETSVIITARVPWFQHAIGGGAVAYQDPTSLRWHLWTRKGGTRFICDIPEAQMLLTEGYVYIGLPGHPPDISMPVYRMPI